MRDPRIDPKVGDVLTKNGDRREIRQVRIHYIEVRTSKIWDGANWLYPTLGQFRKWAATASVEKIA